MNTFRAHLATSAAVLLASQSAHALFVNGGFESGDFSGWTLESGYFYGGTLDNVVWGGLPHSKWAVIGPGALQPGQTLVVTPYGGDFMARINDIEGGNHATRLSQSDVVAPEDVCSGTVLVVQWGAMLVDPKHAPGQQPIFGIKVKRNDMAIASFSADATAAAAPGSGWIAAGDSGGILWYRAGTFELSTSDFQVGDVVTIELAVADCALGGHGGFAFLDGIGTVTRTCDPLADLDDDGTVGASDLGLLLAAWGACNNGPIDPDGCITAPKGLVAWWRAEGDATDSVGDNDGVLVNGAGFGTGFAGSGAFKFDGEDDYVEVASTPHVDAQPCEAMTIVAWALLLSDAPTFQHLLGKRDGCVGSPPNSWQLPISTEWLPVGTWQQLALTIDPESEAFPSGAFLYWLNANPIAAGPLPPSVSNSVPVTIGTSGTCQSFNGLVDEVQIYDRALSQQELQAILEAGASGTCPTLSCEADIDVDGDVDAADLGLLLAAWCD